MMPKLLPAIVTLAFLMTMPGDEIAVAGNYPTRANVIAERNTCGRVAVEDHPTIVRHKAGEAKLSLEHAGSVYTGSIDSSGRFSTPATSFSYPDAEYRIGITGQFSATGFSATVELEKRSRGKTCTYAVAWEATKRGSPNRIPG